MSSWTILTVRGKYAKNYDYSRDDTSDPYDANADIVATMEEDERVRQWTTWGGHVYAYVEGGYDSENSENIIDEYSEMVRDAVVLHANDTTDTGEAMYYPDPTSGWTDKYKETQSEDGLYVGELALCVINSRHGIVARDPFHNSCGTSDDMYLEEGRSDLITITISI